MRGLLTAILVCGAAATALAGATVQLELVGEAQGSNLLFQEWMQSLGNAGIKNVRLRAAADGDKVGIETRGDASRPIYVVTGIVKSRDELILPGGRYRRDQLARLSQWINELSEQGPPAGREEKGPFGLSAAQFQQARADLAADVGFQTAGMSRNELVRKIAARCKIQLKFEAGTEIALGETKCEDELSGFSCGTALAFVLRSAGLGFIPRATGGPVEYCVVRLDRDARTWPVGWSSGRPPQDDLPALYEFLNVNVQNASAAQALDVIGKRLKTPVLIDRLAMEKHKLDPAKAIVSLPRAKTMYSSALRKILFQAGMKYEIHGDEADRAFLWITSLKP